VRILLANGNASAALLIQIEEKILQVLATGLREADGENIQVIENQLNLVEKRLETDLKRLNPGLFTTGIPLASTHSTQAQTMATPSTPKSTGPTIITTVTTSGTTHILVDENYIREQLLKRATALETRANAEIKKLEASNRPALAAGLQLEELRIQQIADELKKSTESEVMRILEGELNLLEIRLDSEIKALENEI